MEGAQTARAVVDAVRFAQGLSMSSRFPTTSGQEPQLAAAIPPPRTKRWYAASEALINH